MLWNLSSFVGCWKIWIERNNRVFNGKSKNVSDIVDVIVWFVSNWASKDKVFQDVSLPDLHVLGGLFSGRSLFKVCAVFFMVASSEWVA